MTDRVVVLVKDMFVQSRVMQIARSHGVDALISTSDKIPKELLDSSDDQVLVIIDLDSSEYDPFRVGMEWRRNFGDRIVLFGFYPHVKADLRKRAEEAGFDHIVTYRLFTSRLNTILQGQ